VWTVDLTHEARLQKIRGAIPGVVLPGESLDFSNTIHEKYELHQFLYHSLIVSKKICDPKICGKTEAGRLEYNTMILCQEIMKSKSHYGVHITIIWALFWSQVSRIFGMSTHCRRLDKISNYSCSFSFINDTNTRHSLTIRHLYIFIMFH